MILCRVTLETLCACAQTCSRLHRLCEDEEIWSSLARRDFGTRLPPPDADFSPRIFFREMLYRNLNGHETTTFLPELCETILSKYKTKACIFMNKFRIVSPNLHDQEIRFVESVFVIANRSKISPILPKYCEIQRHCLAKCNFALVNFAKMFINKIVLRHFREITARSSSLHIIKNCKLTILPTIEHEINISWLF